ncbi:MAG TPA: NAD-dependent epimerase/dehydratase family protein [Noviherbaspirillum sp.]|uniref:NAD-dependent epimerase/dehydratase family protein n=1 Tax=Noviherbaspirillum sp. TaxID=1926288 RepID=UPI002D5A8571|nr:NAD-dependent epimerase/dehydratase family protein [Noviherbaspirillum sp.]HYD97676.1 NAD-dependent epimerase/dehydratase family protein [Noviherbaspirillum sp.]
MHDNSAPVALILGANGRLGHAAVEAFSNAGWKVIAQSRSAQRDALPRAVVSVQCDPLDTDELVRRCGAVQVIVNGLNPAYTEWERLVPPITRSALALARRTGALLMLPGNVYNFGNALPEHLAEDTPQAANTSKARIRIELERQMQSAATEGVRSVVIRAGDFLGGNVPGTWIDLVIAKKLDKQEVVYPGPPDLPHAWAYLPDLAQVFVAVAERRDALAPFEVLHYGGLTLTGLELFHALEAAAGRPLKLRQMPWWLLKMASPVVPMFRALLEMRYLWQRPHRLDESKLRKLIGTVPHTPIVEALRQSLPPETIAPGGVKRTAGADAGPG